MFKRGKTPAYETNVNIDNFISFKYKSILTEVTESDGENGNFSNTKRAIFMKYLSNF